MCSVAVKIFWADSTTESTIAGFSCFGKLLQRLVVYRMRLSFSWLSSKRVIERRVGKFSWGGTSSHRGESVEKYPEYR